MIHTEKKILEIATLFLTEVGAMREDYIIRKAVFQEDEELIRGIHKGNKIPAWVVVIDDNSIFDTTDFLTISDETGEPLYAQSKHGVTEIIKDENGKYSWKDYI